MNDYHTHISNFIRLFLNRIDDYKLDITDNKDNNNMNMIDINLHNNDNKYKEIDDILTDFVINEFMGGHTTMINIFKMVNKLMQFMILEYCRIKNIDNSKIVFISKGGMIISSKLFKYSKMLSPNARNAFNNTYKHFFKRSDLDFSIIIDNNIDNYEDIYNDMSILSYYILSLLRTYLRDSKYDYSDFNKYNNEYKRFILKNVRDKINRSKFINANLHMHVCKVIYNGSFTEEPCARDFYNANKINVYDKFIINYNGNNKIAFPKKVNPKLGDEYKIEPSSDYFISYNSLLDFKNYNDKIRTKFNLIRIKLPFIVYYNSTVDNKISLEDNIRSGELVDIGISHRDSSHYIDINTDIDDITIVDQTCKTYSDKYQLKELELILFETFEYPWDDLKYEKRIARIFALTTINMTGSTMPDLHSKLSYINKTANALENELNKLDNIIHKNVKNKNVKINMEIIINIPNNPFYSIIKNINKLHDIVNNIIDNDIVNDNLDLLINIQEYIKIIHKYYNDTYNIIKYIIDESTGPNIINFERSLSTFPMSGGYKIQSGGYSMCSRLNHKYIIPSLINIFTNYNNIKPSSDVIDIFCSAYSHLVENYKRNDIIRQLFIDKNNKIIFDSDAVNYKFDLPYIKTPSGKQIVVRNNHLSITALSFLSFILGYNCALIVHDGIKWNTETNKNNNNIAIAWDDDNGGVVRKKRIYRDEVLKFNIIEHLEYFCSTLDRLYLRGITTLISLLHQTIFNDLLPKDNGHIIDKKNIGHFILTIEDVKKRLVPLQNKKINKYIENDEYNYIYFNWKNRLIKFIYSRIRSVDNIHINNKIPQNIANNDIVLHNYIRGTINDVIINMIKLVMSQDNTKYDEYGPDNGGFFTWLYLLPKESNNKHKKYGSCITSTYLEIYLLMRLYENPYNIACGLQNDKNDTKHDIWKLTQDTFGKTLSHWTTRWTTLDINGKSKIHIFRNVQAYKTNVIVPVMINDNYNKLLLKALTYQELDMAKYIINNAFRGDIKKKNDIDNLIKKYTQIIDSM